MRPIDDPKQNRIALVILGIPLCWLLMMAVHESGHVIHAWLSGGKVTRVVLDPLQFSRTDLSINPNPLFVSWGGPVWGCLIPIAVWLCTSAAKLTCAVLLRFFAGFCLISNGAYIGSGYLMPVGDAADLLEHGSSAWQLAAFGLIAISSGFLLWNGLARRLGFGNAGEKIDRRSIYIMAALLVFVFGVEFAFFR